MTRRLTIIGAVCRRFQRHPGQRTAAWRADEVLHLVGVASRAGVLALTECRRLEVARGLALNPRIVLLDEVLAGRNRTEVGELVEGLNQEGHTFLVIEHNLKVVRHFSHRGIVIERGAKLAAGTAEDVLRDPRVV